MKHWLRGGPTMACSMGRCARSSPGHFPLCGPVPSNGAWKFWNRHFGLAPAKEMRSCGQGYLPKGTTDWATTESQFEFFARLLPEKRIRLSILRGAAYPFVGLANTKSS